MSEEEDPCPICYSKINIPIAVPGCGHKFCFCCLKGACIGDAEPLCPMCRRQVDVSIFDKASIPGLSLTLAAEFDEDEKPVNYEDGFKEPEDVDKTKTFWLYSGGGDGWWRFEPRDEEDINKAFLKGEATIELSICGHVYIIDFAAMEQRRKNNQRMLRKVVRVTEDDLKTINVKGIAGMRCT